MSSNLDKYIPEFDEDEARSKLSNLTREQLLEMLLYAYKEKRVWAKMLEVEQKKLDKIRILLDEPSTLAGMPGIPTADDLRRMTEDES
ncbi:hypothetical protein [Tunturibacter empetritectus]|uniref:Uncharacterized protein n=1 Tax=Tunturiibacter empetritectus TaxID=3069691 RepID=A0A7W8IJX8_9BACT|nr:hypothetical protein [Edaphobacter lichenicola]MBB5318541.1 hypothetical protein [Edaphobacter lichenicola]